MEQLDHPRQYYRVSASRLAESNFRYTHHRNTCPKHFSLDPALSSSGPVLTGENRGLECGGHWLARSCDPRNGFSTCACLVIEFGGHLSKVVDRGAVWFRAKICYPAADFAPPAIAVVEPAKDYFLLRRARPLLSSRATKADPQSSPEPQSLFGHGRRPSPNWPVFLDAISKMGVPPRRPVVGAQTERENPHATLLLALGARERP